MSYVEYMNLVVKATDVCIAKNICPDDAVYQVFGKVPLMVHIDVTNAIRENIKERHIK